MKTVKTTPNAIEQQVKIMTGAKIVDELQLSSDEAKAVVDYSRAFQEAGNKNQKLVELLYSHGKRSYHFVGASDEDSGLVAFRNKIIDQVVLGFDADAQKLYRAEPKTLNMTQQAMQTVIKGRVTDTFANIKKAMVRFETKALSGETDKKKPKTNEQMVAYYVKQALEKMTKCKNGWEGMLKDKQALESLAVLKQVKLPK